MYNEMIIIKIGWISGAMIYLGALIIKH